MKKRGFTLIEMLVVVLIIGILAGIAVPQYRRATLKSKFATLMPAARALADAEDAYYLETRRYTENMSELDFSPTSTPNIQVTANVRGAYQWAQAERPSDLPGVRLIMYYKKSATFPGETHCEANTVDGKWLCQSLGGVPVSFASGGYIAYRLGRGGAGVSRDLWDTNGDGEGNISDINAIINDYLNGNGDALTPEERDCYKRVVIDGQNDPCFQELNDKILNQMGN